MATKLGATPPAPQEPKPVQRRGLGSANYGEFSSDYIQSTFVAWYNAGKPAPEKFYDSLNAVDPTHCPSIRTLTRWIVDDFSLKAIELDRQVEKKMDVTLIESKLEMLERQAVVGQKMQEMAWNYLLEEGPENARNAITLLKLGLETEREARSVPGFLKGMTEKTDVEIVEEIHKLMAGEADILDLSSDDVEDEDEPEA